MHTVDKVVQFLREERKRQHLTQSEFAQRAGIPFRSYQRLEAAEPGIRLSAVLRAYASLGFELNPVSMRRPTLDELDQLYGNDADI